MEDIKERLRRLNEANEKYRELGFNAKVLLDLHLENPSKWDAEKILENLFKQYEKLGFKPTGGDEDGRD